MLKKVQKRIIRHKRVRAKVFGTAERPRMAVFRSNTNIYVQVIDDEKGITLASSSSLKINEGTKTEQARKVGEDIAKKCLAKNIDKVVFDKGGFAYTGRVEALASAAREAGLNF